MHITRAQHGITADLLNQIWDFSKKKKGAAHSDKVNLFFMQNSEDTDWESKEKVTTQYKCRLGWKEVQKENLQRLPACPQEGGLEVGETSEVRM